jgi:paraquat-inducible protein A
MMGLSASGFTSSTTIIGGVKAMWVEGEKITALLVGFCVVVAPALQIGFMLLILLAVRRFPAPSWAGTLLRWVEFHQPWAMVEVMMLGVLVSLVKIADMATVIPGIGMFSLGALIFIFTAMTAAFDPEKVWERVRWANGEVPRAPGLQEERREVGR